MGTQTVEMVLRWLMVFLIYEGIASGKLRAEIRAAGPMLNNESVAVHLPEPQHLRNRGGNDGLGLCVFASLSHAGKYQHEPVAEALFEFMFRQPGGGYPEKVTRMFEACARELQRSVPMYVQHTGGDVAFLQLALRTGRYPCVTYSGADHVFYRQRVAHMVNLVRLDERSAVIHDNNFPGQYLWMSNEEFVSRWKDMGGGWAIVLLHSPPPPVPTNAEPVEIESPVAQLDPIFGVEEAKIPRELRYEINGVSASRQQVFQAFGEPIPDDRNKLFVTVVGDEELRSRVLRDFDEHRSLKWWKSRVHLQSYPMDHWMVKTIGLQSGVTIQQPPDTNGRGIVSTRLRNYDSNDAPILVDALRRADPNYKPELDPDPQTIETPLFSMNEHLREFGLLLAALIGISFRDRLLSLMARMIPGRKSIDPVELEAFRRWLAEQSRPKGS